MKVRLAGYDLKLNYDLTYDALFKQMQERMEEGRHNFLFHDRVLHVAKDADHHIIGRILTDRGHKNFLAIDSKTNAISVGSIGKDKNFGAFNFFVLCPKRNKALITLYQDAGRAAFVFRYLSSLGNEALGIDGDATSIDYSEILGKEELEGVLKRWKKIRSVELAYSQQAGPPDFLPVSSSDEEILGRVSLKYGFKRGTKLDRIIEFVTSLWKSKEAKEAEVVRLDGIDELGLTRRVELDDTIPSLFGDLDHDDIISDKSSFSDNLSNSFVVRSLKEAIKDSPKIFG